jgi:hypothetical protein
MSLEKGEIDINAALAEFKESYDKEHQKHYAAVDQSVNVLKAHEFTGWECVQHLCIPSSFRASTVRSSCMLGKRHPILVDYRPAGASLVLGIRFKFGVLP